MEIETNQKQNIEIIEPVIFADKVKKNNETLFVSIPIKDARYLGIEAGSNVRVWIKKIEE